MSDPRGDDRRSDRGSVMVVAALAMVALLLFAALAIDVGFVWNSRTQSQNVSDSAALAAAKKMIKQEGTNVATVELADARAEGVLYASQNSTVANPSAVVRDPDDFEFGWWDTETRTLDTSVDQADPDLITGVRVNMVMDDGTNKRSPTFLSQLLGRDGFDVNNTSVAYLGFEGDFEPGDFDLPIAIDSCKIAAHGGTCEAEDERCGCDFCETAASVPNATLLTWPQGVTTVTLLEFSSTPDQNACWTVFDGDSASVNNPDLTDVVDRGNSGGVEAGDEVYADNGDKTSTQKYLRDKFYGCNNTSRNCCTDTDAAGNCTARTGTPGGVGQPPAGMNRYKPDPTTGPGPLRPGIDSWVVKLPVFECIPGRNCSGGDPMALIGGVCIEIREILEPAGDYGAGGLTTHQIKGRFLCPDSPTLEERELFNQYCRDEDEGSGPGGCNFGLRAKDVVLVE
jgi:hypothetical protein